MPPHITIRERELAELRSLVERVYGADGPSGEDVIAIVSAVFSVLEPRLEEPMRRTVTELVQAELPATKPDIDKLDLRQRSALATKLRSLALKRQDWEQVAEQILYGIFGSLSQQLPKTQAPSPFTIPLVATLENPREWISSLYKTLFDERYLERDLFEKLRDQMYVNLCYQSGVTPYTDSKRAFKHAKDSDLPLDKLNDAYLGRTPFHELFKTPVPLRLTHEERFNHMHIVGGTGAGKTSLIETLILHDIQSEESPSLVLIDPHGDLIKKLVNADIGISDRLIMIDPRDIKHPPALNIFALNQERLEQYDEATREQVTAGVIQTFDYLFSGLIGADLTAKQGMLFRYVARLMLAIPEGLGRNATIIDMLKLMSDTEPYLPAIELLSDIPRDFFLEDFNSKTFQQTKEQIRYRLQAILENPTMARLFTSPETKIDLFAEMNRGSIILVDTAKDYLKGASENFGRVFISLTLQAVLERAAIAPSERRPVFLIVDEAASYFDSNIDDLLTEARKYRCGLVLAHQYLDQASSSLRASLAANTGSKFASGISASDARSMATDMRTTTDFILGQPRLQFAAHIRGVTPHAVSIPITPGLLERQPRLSPEDLDELMERNRQRVSIPREEKPRVVPKTEDEPVSQVSPHRDEDISSEW